MAEKTGGRASRIEPGFTREQYLTPVPMPKRVMKKIVVVIVTITNLMITTAYVNDTSYENITTLDSTTSQREKEYIVIRDDIEFIELYNTIKMIYKGTADRKLFFEDLNGTQYVIIPKTVEEKITEIKEQLEDANHTGLICTDRCRTREEAELTLETLEAGLTGDVIPNLRSEYFAVVSVFSAIGITGVIGNALILFAVIKSKKLRNSTGVLLCSLALSDILVLAVWPPLKVTKKYTPNARSVPVCQLGQVTKAFSIVVSTATMTVMAVERYIAICHPLKARYYCTVKNARIAVSVVWIFSIAISCLLVPLVQDLDGGNRDCRLVFADRSTIFAYHICLVILVFGIPVLIMVPLYFKIFWELWRSNEKLSKLHSDVEEPNLAQQNDTRKSRQQVMKMLAVVLALFVICWGPATALDTGLSLYMLSATTAYKREWAMTSFVLETMAISNSCFNPLVFIIMSRQFRLQIKSWFSRRSSGKHTDVDIVIKKNTSFTVNTVVS